MTGEISLNLQRDKPLLKLQMTPPAQAPAALVAAILGTEQGGQSGQGSVKVYVSPAQNFPGPALWIKTDAATGAVVDLLLVSAGEPAQV